VLVIALAWWQLGKDRASVTAASRAVQTASVPADSTRRVPSGPAAPVMATPPRATAARGDSMSAPPAADPAPKTVERPAPKPERPAPSERVARNTTPPATKPAPSAARPPVTPPPRTAASNTTTPAPTTVAVAPPVVNTQPSIAQTPATQPPVQQGVAAPRPAAGATQSQASPAESPPPAPAPPSAADVAPVFEAYARAIESRDVSAIRRVYPGLTPEQQRGFEQFFESARKINVTFRVASVDGSPSTADVRVTGRYEYENSAGRSERTPVSFAAGVRKDGSAWRLVAVRER
jgi:hypothetical protein